ncbi:hypothetical protein AK812_SmicGene35702 [Symbiodinium microadriaticum]|uniref:Uncharacterized protein n=1 Tax=Symbiodinium microadriaticum TaxID=2951 RepID=A0A1Q9CKT4_SYMMI|nr:hypothetical protein AK812_SmicGene35702 [Symbiodinium microadriaticum]CAE7833012.1 unnamed protein product [Symbiodinium sp. KB8]CAE7887092.1 unnamed protein product [Symbiodinium microadriaticum]
MNMLCTARSLEKAWCWSSEHGAVSVCGTSNLAPWGTASAGTWGVGFKRASIKGTFDVDSATQFRQLGMQSICRDQLILRKAHPPHEDVTHIYGTNVGQHDRLRLETRLQMTMQGDTALHLAASQDHKAVARLEQSADI